MGEWKTKNGIRKYLDFGTVVMTPFGEGLYINRDSDGPDHHDGYHWVVPKQWPRVERKFYFSEIHIQPEPQKDMNVVQVKVGDIVVCDEAPMECYDSLNGWFAGMDALIGKEMVVEEISVRGVKADGFVWPFYGLRRKE